MSLDKSIISKKEHRKPYYDSKAFDRSCRNHGSCSYCLGNRMYKNKKKEQSAAEQEKDFAEFSHPQL